MSEERVQSLSQEDFDDQLGRTTGPVLVDFWAAWCAPCKVVAPRLEELAEELGDRVRVVKVDVDESGNLANRYGIRSIPTLIVFKEGKVVDQLVGAAPKAQIRRMLERHID